ncbi:MAG TPA: class I SAM-dependent methyltransferase [Acidimicrobiia bacterium]
MVSARVYDWMYRVWAPWDSVGVRKDLIDLLTRGDVDPRRYPRSIDVGCGTGANVVHLAGAGFDAWGVDFSEIAIRKGRARAAAAGLDAHFVVGDLTAPSIPGIEGTFDFVVDFGTLDDLRGESRAAMADTITRLSHPGSKFLEYCFYGETEELPLISFRGTSKLSHIAPGELDELFGDDWEIEPFSRDDHWRVAAFLLTKRA